jgi:hypothetical protein
METKTNVLLPLDPTMCKWFLRVVNADPRSVYEFVEVRGFRAPTTDEAQRAWGRLVGIEYGLVMPIASLMVDSTLLNSKKIPEPGSEAATRPNDPYANREVAYVRVGEATMSLDEFLRRQRFVNDGARAASPILFNAGMYIYRHLSTYNKSMQPFQKEFTLFTQFSEDYSSSRNSIQIYGVKLKPDALLRKIAFLCFGCRRHCTTFVPFDVPPNSTHWCGGIVCEIAGPLSKCAVTAVTYQPHLDLRLTDANFENLIRGSGSTATVMQLTQCTNIDESLELWCAVMNGDLVPNGMSDVWVPSATAWRFHSMWDTDYSAEFGWPHNVKATQWHPISRYTGRLSVVTADNLKAAHRCKRLSRRQHESSALLAIEDMAASTVASSEISSALATTFPTLFRVGSDISLLARIVLYFQHTRTRMCETTQEAFVAFLMRTAAAPLVALDNLMAEQETRHNDPTKPCTCSQLQSFLTTNSNRVLASVADTPKFKTVNHMQEWDGCKFADIATDAWQRRWGTRRHVLRTRIQDLKAHIANLNVSMTATDDTSIRDQTEGTRVLAELTHTSLPFAPIDLVSRNRRSATPVEVRRLAAAAVKRTFRSFSWRLIGVEI